MHLAAFAIFFIPADPFHVSSNDMFVGSVRKGLGLKMKMEILGRDLFGPAILQFIRTSLSSHTHSCYTLVCFQGMG